jgi:hypothetical protein
VGDTTEGPAPKIPPTGAQLGVNTELSPAPIILLTSAYGDGNTEDPAGIILPTGPHAEGPAPRIPSRAPQGGIHMCAGACWVSIPGGVALVVSIPGGVALVARPCGENAEVLAEQETGRGCWDGRPGGHDTSDGGTGTGAGDVSET